MKTFLVTCLVCGSLAVASNAAAQNMYWTFTDDQEPVMIPAECDARFDEVRGGVFVPSTDDVYDYGMNFLNSDIESVQKQAPYCFLAAALGGHPKAQLELARMYNEGKYLPQDDLSAYKWSFISALNGNKEAERFALTLEQFLTTSDLEATTNSIHNTRVQIETALHQGEAERAGLDADAAQDNAQGRKGGLVAPKALLNIFGEEDRLK